MKLIEIGIVVFWALTYLLIIIESLAKDVKPGIPVLAIILNFSWEAVLVLRGVIHGTPFWGHILWLVLDLVVVLRLLQFCDRSRLVVMLTGGVLLLFSVSWIKDVILISVFAIDLIMAVAYLFALYRNQIRLNAFSLAIGFGRLFGDFCAFYGNKETGFVSATGAIVLLLNLAYIAFLILKMPPEPKGRARR